MSRTGATIFNKTLEKTHIWLRELMQELDWRDEHKAYSALRVVLHTLRDRLTVEEATQLSAQLPMLVRGFYFEGWDPTQKPVRERHLDEFLNHVKACLRGDGRTHPEKVVRGVFKVLSKHVTEGEIGDIKRVIPEELRMLWPDESKEKLTQVSY
jgi:uncharacterized protein (DUF2267 family)